MDEELPEKIKEKIAKSEAALELCRCAIRPYSVTVQFNCIVTVQFNCIVAVHLPCNTVEQFRSHLLTWIELRRAKKREKEELRLAKERAREEEKVGLGIWAWGLRVGLVAACGFRSREEEKS